MKPIVLFVDDEPNILSGLRRMMRAQRDVWDMRFAEGGPQALAMLEAEQVDAVVSDMRMPGVDGADLMESVAARTPGAIRVILSGEADRGLTYRTVGRSHRFLAKPCDPAAIAASLNAPLAQRARLANALAAADGADVSTLWTPEPVYKALVSAVRTASPDIAEVSAVVRADPALAARVLQLVNSAYFGPPRITADIDDAVRSLGVDILRDLAIDGRLARAVSPVNGASGDAGEPEPAEVARAAEAAARATHGDPAFAARAYATGLLMRLGARLATDAVAPPRDAQIAISAYLCRLMGLPERLCDALETLAPQTDIGDVGDIARAVVEALEAAEAARTRGAA